MKDVECSPKAGTVYTCRVHSRANKTWSGGGNDDAKSTTKWYFHISIKRHSLSVLKPNSVRVNVLTLSHDRDSSVVSSFSFLKYSMRVSEIEIERRLSTVFAANIHTRMCLCMCVD